METRLLLRNGEQLVLALVIPVLALVAGVLGAARVGIDLAEPAVDVLTPGVLALAVMSTSFASLAIATGFERRYGVLKRLGTSPLPRTGLLLGKVVALLSVQVVQVVVISAVGLGLGWRPSPDLPAAVAALVLGTAAFASLGLLVAGALRAEATLALANLVFLLLMVGGGVVLPTEEYGALGGVVALLPSGALGDAMRTAFIDGAFAGGSLLVLAAWAAAGTALTARTFSWE
ncbi:ABC transporter permease [Nocardioidaceae bacterium]|nr:ABC transporter permease [Nocardioidaceae bacterium]